MNHEKKSPAPDGRPEISQPDWRRDFPIDSPQDHYVARRDFTRFLVLTSLAFVVGQFWIAVQNWFRRRAGDLPISEIAHLDQLPIGTATTFTYPDEEDTCLLLRLDAQTLVAYNQKCTHLSCAVTPDLANRSVSAAGQLLCPCHRGVFDAATGRPLAGPPRRPLTRITLEVHQGVVYATGVEQRTV